MKSLWLTGLALLLVNVSVCQGQFAPLPTEPFKLTSHLSADAVTPGGTFRVALVWKMPPGYYLYRDHISARPLHGRDFTSFDVDIPPGVAHFDEITPQPQQVFFNELKVLMTCVAPKDLPLGTFKTEIEVGWQGCGAGACFRPAFQTIAIELPVVMNPAGIKQLNPELFVSSVRTLNHPDQSRTFSLPVSALLALVGGIWASLTPCVFPLIPVIIGVVGIETGKTSRMRGLWLSAAYVAGLVLVYALLGGLAGLLGKIVVIDPRDVWVRVGGAFILVALAAAMFGWYNIALPGWLTSRLSGRWAGGAVGAVLAGVASAMLATTCVAVPLLTALGYAATAQSVPTGMLLGGSFALGMGLLLLVVGTFAGLVERLASGEWMVWVKYAMGMTLVGMAIYFLQPVLPGAVWKFALAGFLLVAGILALMARSRLWLLRVIAVILILGAGTLGTLTVLGMSGHGVWKPAGDRIAWVTDVDAGLARAMTEGKPAIIDFSATWCRECDVMDVQVFSDPKVVSESRNFVMIRADISDKNDRTMALQKRFGVYLPPTVVFVNRDGSFRTVAAREGKDEFLSNVRRLK